ncbi:CBS domain-containing protein [Acidianus sulfidivorans JP7]|uniref:Histidine kinase n=1 Tax=Acidianus sulfidivorans JP7 TaxID=619593 RepID=A0A2U9IK90_9CREN|nr:CBS domain-containing protein [Acidianus sulfidivorans]AWR96451.1 CBS domain-containing protein [Acidianus sulfidivorans JP7]
MSIEEIAIEPKVVANADSRLGEIIAKMKEENQWSVPVLLHKKLVGILTYKDLLKKRVSLDSKVITVSSPSISIQQGEDFGKVIAKFYTTKARAIPVVNKNKELIGLITRETVLKYLLDTNQIGENKVREYMSSPVISAEPEESVARVRWLMLRDNISRIPILNNKKLEGIISARDIVNALYSINERKRASILTEEERIMAMPIKELMTSPVIYVNGSSSLKSVAQLLLSKGISGAPVVEGDFVSGIISSIDIIKSLESKYNLSMPIQAKLTSDLKKEEIKAEIDAVLERYLSKLEKITDIIDFKVSFKETAKSSEGKTLYKTTITASTNQGNFVASETDWDPIVAVKKAVEKIENNIIKKIKKLENKKVSKEEE